MKQPKSILSIRLKLQQLRSETFFITTGIPGIVGPMASLNNLSTSLRAMQLSTNALKKGAVTACECARSVCKPVDDLLKRPSSPMAYRPHTYTSHYAPAIQPMPAMYALDMPPMMDPSADLPHG